MTRLVPVIVAALVLLTGCIEPSDSPPPTPTHSATPTPSALSTAPPLYCNNPHFTLLDQPNNVGEVSPLAASASWVGIGGAAVVVKETRSEATVRIVDDAGRTVTELKLHFSDDGWLVDSIAHCTVKESG